MRCEDEGEGERDEGERGEGERGEGERGEGESKIVSRGWVAAADLKPRRARRLWA